MKGGLPLFFALAILQTSVAVGFDNPAETFFEQKIRPILATACYKCHGDKKQESGLRVDARAGLMQGGDAGPAIVPGNPGESLLIQAVAHKGEFAMPPGRKLSQEQIGDLERWVEQGAQWPSSDKPVAIRSGEITDEDKQFWSFQPVEAVPPPDVDDPTHWGRNEVDAFILDRLQPAKLKPAPPADRRALIRRATFDLTGLPPTPQEVDAFLKDPAPDAFERVVERLLASPRYGERWGRHWLDVVRYADTAGETADYPVPEAYLYRDYVIRAFNKDKPYDQFVREQVAGDLLGAEAPPERFADMVTATGFIAISRRFGFDPENYHHLTIQDSIDTLGQSVLGLSLGCARCHNHKFDPVMAGDYYALFGIFESTRYAFPGSEEKKRPRDFVPLIPPAEARAKDRAYTATLDRLKADIKALDARKAEVDSQLLPLVGLDGSFEAQALGSGPGSPWMFLDGARVAATAQSPYANVSGAGTRGVSLPNNSANNAFGQLLPINRRPATHGVVHANLDFRVVDAANGGQGTYRFYMGHGPGVSAAVELFFNAGQFFARSGDAVEPIREVKPGTWYQVQLAVDLDARTYSGTVGVPGDLTTFSGKALASNWDGNLDYTFVDGYGHLGGNKPASEVDNLIIQDEPLAALGSPSAPAATSDPGQAERLTKIAALRSSLDAISAERMEKDQARATLERTGPYPMAYGVAEGTPHDARIQKRGEPTTPGDEVPRRFLQILGGDKVPPNSGSGRLALAEWLTRPSNPLTARVMVNRIWQHHFGKGLVATENDFGRRGQKPTHPALLDYLAGRFMVEGWSVKSIHRRIMLSSTYQQSSEAEPSAETPDPTNDLLARFSRRRLDAEEIRDAMLFVAGTLETGSGGRHPFPPVETWAFSQHGPFNAVYDTRRRSVFLMTQRIKRHPYLALFDGPDPNATTARRSATTVPTQALFFMNDPFVHEQATAFAQRVLDSGRDETAKVGEAFERALGRPHSADESSESLAFLAAVREDLEPSEKDPAGRELRAWSALARTLLVRNEFLFVD